MEATTFHEKFRPFHLPLHIVHPYHHCHPLMTSRNHLSFEVEFSDCRIQPKKKFSVSFFFKIRKKLTIRPLSRTIYASRSVKISKGYIIHTILSASMIVCNR